MKDAGNPPTQFCNKCGQEDHGSAGCHTGPKRDPKMSGRDEVIRSPSNIRITPYGANGFVVEWQKSPTDPDEFKTLQNRAQLMRLLEILVDEGAGKDGAEGAREGGKVE